VTAENRRDDASSRVNTEAGPGSQPPGGRFLRGERFVLATDFFVQQLAYVESLATRLRQRLQDVELGANDLAQVVTETKQFQDTLLALAEKLRHGPPSTPDSCPRCRGDAECYAVTDEIAPGRPGDLKKVYEFCHRCKVYWWSADSSHEPRTAQEDHDDKELMKNYTRVRGMWEQRRPGSTEQLAPMDDMPF
jgi:hypothetical protein